MWLVAITRKSTAFDNQSMFQNKIVSISDGAENAQKGFSPWRSFFPPKTTCKPWPLLEEIKSK